MPGLHPPGGRRLSGDHPHPLPRPGRGGARRGVHRGLLALLLVAAAGCSKVGAAPPAPRLALSPCRIEGIPWQARCGTYEVYEDRAARSGRKIALRVVVVPALAPNPEPDPLFYLAGGPGQAASESHALQAVERLHRNRDIVLVDQRGTGSSNRLACDLHRKDDRSLAALFDDTWREEALRACLASYGDTDVRHYTTPVAMDDLDEVREALGYERINLWGVSYGTRAALVYMRQHPERVRTATLDGVAPLSLYLPLYVPRDGQRALELALTHCEQDAACARAYPQLRARVVGLVEQLKREPVRTRVAHPLTGVAEDLTLTSSAVMSALQGQLYMPELAALLPLALDRAAGGDWGPFVALSYAISSGMEKSMSQGMFFSIVCAEDAPFITEEAAAREAQGSWFGDTGTRNTLRACAVWPKGRVPEGYREPVTSPVPTLLLSGELDPVTPPSWAEDAKRTLSRSLHVVVPGVGHNTLGIGCVRTLMADFVTRGGVEGLSSTCGEGLARPPFITSFAGSVP
ncbi:alpha/beta hydrolase [Myxococcaceae bacterium GXIMD 01537]